VDLDGGKADGGDGVAERDRRMRVRAGVEENGVEPAGGLVDPLDELALVVRLARVDLDAELRAEAAERRVDLRERRTAVDIRLTRPEEVEVGPMKDEDSQSRPPPPASEARRADWIAWIRSRRLGRSG
jgi:hypothetical protein